MMGMISERPMLTSCSRCSVKVSKSCASSVMLMVPTFEDFSWMMKVWCSFSSSDPSKVSVFPSCLRVRGAVLMSILGGMMMVRVLMSSFFSPLLIRVTL